MNKYTLIIIVISILSSNTFAQEPIRYQHEIIARPTHDSIMLRWAPSNYDTWRKGIKQGYVIERTTFYSNSAILPSALREKKVIGPIIPWKQEMWEKHMDKDNYIGVAASSMYGESFTPEAGEESSIIQMFNAATEQQNRYSFALFSADMSITAAIASGLYYADHNVQYGDKYLYRIYVNSQDTIPIDTAYVFTGPDESTPLNKPHMEEVQPDDKIALITWRRLPGRQEYSAFYVERSSNSGASYKKLNSSPMINVSDGDNSPEVFYYIDTLPQNNIRYTYRIQGVTPFGELGPYSDTASTVGIDRIKALPEIVNHQIIGSTVQIDWFYPEKHLKRIKGFQIFRGDKARGEYAPVSSVLDKTERSFTDIEPKPTSYYKIKVFDKNGRGNYSLSVLVQLPDTIPPEPPAGLQAKIDSTGTVILTWNSNSEEDIYGYRIYRANAAHEEFSQITVAPVRDTMFTDYVSLKTLSPKVYYKILANDKRQNFSDFSEILVVTRPDTIPPSAPVMQQLHATDTGVCISWINSSSHDALKTILLRRVKDSINWERIKTFQLIDTSYCDPTPQPGIVYRYAILSADNNGNTSEISNTYSAKIKQTACLNIKEASYKIDRDNNSIRLEWLMPPCASRYIIYRGTSDDPVKTYKTVYNKVPYFEDTSLVPDTQYKYAIKAISEADVSGPITSINVDF